MPTPCATPSRARRRAICRWWWPDAADPVEGLLRHARVRSDHARAAAGLRPLSARGLQAGRVRQLQAPRGLLGQGPARQPRPLQLRRAALRVLSRPHGGARELQGRRLRPARGVHRAGLGHGLRHPCRQGGPTAPPHPARREPVGRAGLLPQHAPAQARRHSRAQGARLRLRLRVDQQEHLLRSLHPHRELLRELRHEGLGQAEPGRAGAAGALARPAAGRGVRRGLQVAGLGRLGTGPQAAARGRAAAGRGRLAGQGRQARQRQGRGARARVPDHGPDDRAHPDGLREEPAGHRRSDDDPPHRPGAVRAPRQVVRLRRGHHALRRCA